MSDENDPFTSSELREQIDRKINSGELTIQSWNGHYRNGEDLRDSPDYLSYRINDLLRPYLIIKKQSQKFWVMKKNLKSHPSRMEDILSDVLIVKAKIFESFFVIKVFI